MKKNAGSWFTIGGSGLVLASIIAALFIIDSPGTMRLKRLDEQRVQDLQGLSENVKNYYRNKKELPAALDTAAAAGFTMFARSARDPVTGVNYEYRVAGPQAFELCAAFQAVADETTEPWQPNGGAFWQHGIGRRCFNFDAPKDKP